MKVDRPCLAELNAATCIGVTGPSRHATTSICRKGASADICKLHGAYCIERQAKYTVHVEIRYYNHVTDHMHKCLQVIQPDLLREGFELVRQKQLEVTDDVSIIEALGRPVKVTQGSYTNIKVQLRLCARGLLSTSILEVA